MPSLKRKDPPPPDQDKAGPDKSSSRQTKAASKRVRIKIKGSSLGANESPGRATAARRVAFTSTAAASAGGRSLSSSRRLPAAASAPSAPAPASASNPSSGLGLGKASSLRFNQLLSAKISGGQAAAAADGRRRGNDETDNDGGGKPPAASNGTPQTSTQHQEELRAEERRKRLEEELHAMLSTSKGRAFLFVEKVITAGDRFDAAAVFGDGGIVPVARDDMFFTAERLLKCQRRFRNAGKPEAVDIGFHYTRAESMTHIQRAGLTTKADRRDRAEENRLNNGSVFGDGVYTAENPVAFKKYGEVGLLVARLKGNSLRIKAEEVNKVTNCAAPRKASFYVKAPTGHKALSEGYDTVIGNKENVPRPGAPQPPAKDEVVLLRSQQCVPLLRFPRDLIPDHPECEIPSVLRPWCEEIKEVVDEFFNSSVSSSLTRDALLPDPVTPNGSQPNASLPVVHAKAASTAVAVRAGAAATATGAPTSAPAASSSGASRQVNLALGQASASTAARPLAVGTVSFQPLVKYQAPDTLQSWVGNVVSEVGMGSLQAGEVCALCQRALEGKSGVERLIRCSHSFCRRCKIHIPQHSRCPACLTRHPVGKSPSGEMQVQVSDSPHLKCQGHSAHATVVIEYTMQGGSQKTYHNFPGRPFAPAKRTAFLPYNQDGRRLLQRLQYAFGHGLIFKIGKSLITGKSGAITWGSIPHKTTVQGGPHGWPIPDYFESCNMALDDLGIPSGRDCP